MQKGSPCVSLSELEQQSAPDFPGLGYHDYLSVPWDTDRLFGKFYNVLPEGKKPILKDLWEKAKKERIR